jgi:peroxidase
MQAGGPFIDFPTGRRDGVVSQASAVNLPGPSVSVSQAIAAFQSIGLNVNDLVTLLGENSFTAYKWIHDTLSLNFV